MADVKILGSVWFSSLKGHFGIVVTDNGHEEKAYIGMCNGEDEKADEILIASYGAKFPLKQAKELIKANEID